MPYLQLDTPFSYSTEDKQRLAVRLGQIYAQTMRSNINRLTVAIRELGEGSIWRCGEDNPRPAALLMADDLRSCARCWPGSSSTRVSKSSGSGRTT